jgi:hypothetical protein
MFHPAPVKGSGQSNLNPGERLGLMFDKRAHYILLGYNRRIVTGISIINPT